MQLALTSLLGDITMTIAIRGNDEDERIVNRFFDMIIANMNEFVRLNAHRLEDK